MRFRAEQHLRRASDIRAVRETGQRVDCRAFTVWWKRRDEAMRGEATPPTGSALHPRVCVIASRAAVGGAVRRNRAKRRLREVFRQQQNAIPENCDLLLIARAAATEWPLGNLGQKFSEACRRISSELPTTRA